MTNSAHRIASMVVAVAEAIEEAQGALDRLDAIAADGDHGATMVIGWRAVAAAVQPVAGRPAARLLKDAGAAFAEVGGSIGPLWGTALLRAGRALHGVEHVDLRAAANAVQAGVDGMVERGRAKEGDKTLLDVMGPAARELAAAAEAGAAPAVALWRAVDAAAAGLRRTAVLHAARGRAKRLPDRSRGHQDPGAASAFLIWRTCAALLAPGLEVPDAVEV